MRFAGRLVVVAAAVLLTTSCGRGSGTVIHHGILPPYNDLSCSKIGDVLSCSTTHFDEQPYVIVQGLDGGTSKDLLDWADYRSCTQEPERPYPQCADEG